MINYYANYLLSYNIDFDTCAIDSNNGTLVFNGVLGRTEIPDNGNPKLGEDENADTVVSNHYDLW